MLQNALRRLLLSDNRTRMNLIRSTQMRNVVCSAPNMACTSASNSGHTWHSLYLMYFQRSLKIHLRIGESKPTKQGFQSIRYTVLYEYSAYTTYSTGIQYLCTVFAVSLEPILYIETASNSRSTHEYCTSKLHRTCTHISV